MEHAAARELKEETGLDPGSVPLVQVGREIAATTHRVAVAGLLLPPPVLTGRSRDQQGLRCNLWHGPGSRGMPPRPPCSRRQPLATRPGPANALLSLSPYTHIHIHTPWLVHLARTSRAQVGAFGDPGRDPRGWTVTVCYAALVPPQARSGIQAAVSARGVLASHCHSARLEASVAVAW